MSSSTGMAGLAVTALVSAVVALGVSALMSPAPAPPVPAPAHPVDSTGSLRSEVERLRAEVAELRGGRTVAAPGTTPSSSPASGPPVAGAPVPATREELRTFVDERVAERLAAGLPPGTGKTEVVRRTLDEAGAELGLSSVDLDSAKRVWRDSETEALALLMGTADIDAVREEVKAAAEDPDRKAALVTRVVGNMVRNLGKIATIEDRRNRELRKFLTEDQVKRLKGMNIRPTIDDLGMDDIFKGTFGD